MPFLDNAPNRYQCNSNGTYNLNAPYGINSRILLYSIFPACCPFPTTISLISGFVHPSTADKSDRNEPQSRSADVLNLVWDESPSPRRSSNYRNRDHQSSLYQTKNDHNHHEPDRPANDGLSKNDECGTSQPCKSEEVCQY